MIEEAIRFLKRIALFKFNNFINDGGISRDIS